MDNENESALPSRRERERETHRREIIAVAEAVFSAHGFDGTTVEMIAREADFSVGSIYNFFQGKEDLFHHVFLSVAMRRNESIRAAVAEPLRTGRPWEALRALVDAWIAYYREHREFLRTAFSAVTAGGTRNRPRSAPPPEFIECFRQYYREIDEVFASLLRAPDARPFSVRQAACIAVGVIREILTRAGYDPLSGCPRDIDPAVSDEAFESLRLIFRKEQP